MQKKYHYIAGLPRSGSTMLNAILSQNPRFHSDISDPLAEYVTSIINASVDPIVKVMITPEKVKNVISGVFDGFYKHIDREVIFNCNRHWSRYVEYLYQLNDNFRMICCVRDYNCILNSFELNYKSRSLTDPVTNSYMYGSNILTVWHRTDHMANEGFLRINYNSLKEAFYGPYRKHLLFVEYDDLTKFPKETLRRIYDFIEEPYYDHDFNNVVFSNHEYDSILNAPNLHTVRKKVQPQELNKVLPPDLWDKYSNWEFWR